MKKRPVILFLLLLSAPVLFSQTRFSLATNVSVQRSLKKEQQYWAVGQTVAGHFHLTARSGIYAWFTYYTDGKFSNQLTAVAKSSTTNPSTIGYTNRAEMRLRELSFGWQQYLKGSTDAEKGWNLYLEGGLGLLLGRIRNSFSTSIDTSAYNVAIKSGKANFKRLTFDATLGFEKPLGGDVFLYAETCALLPITDYPSPYLLVNDNAPVSLLFNLGVRILFD